MKTRFKVFLIFALAMCMVFPAFAADRANFSVDNLVVNKSLTVAGLLTAAANTTGNVFYVDSGVGINAVNGGKSAKAPLDDLDYAVGLCTANNGDFIILMPGHNEGITTAADIDIDVAGVTVIGLGAGEDMPTIDFDAAAASVAVGADNVVIANVRFRVSANATVVGLDIEAGFDETQVLNCQFGFAETATDEFAIALRNNAGCNNTIIDGCLFEAGAQAAVVGISITGASDRPKITNCEFWGAHSTACINGITTLSTQVMIKDNFFYQGATEPAIELLTGTTGVVMGNMIKTNLATMVASIVGDAVFLFQNYYNEDVNPGTGALIGTASAND